MAQQEICQVVRKERQSFSKTWWWWEAHQVSPKGTFIIAKSSEYTHPDHERGLFGVLVDTFLITLSQNDANIWEHRQRTANNQVVAQLLGKGWEVAAVNSDGLITMLRRNIEQDESASSQKPISDQRIKEKKVIIKCENCDQKLSIPLRRKNLHVTCPKCRHEFNYEFVEGNPIDD